MELLIIGAAGYIGSHCVQQALDAGHRVVALDNLSSGHKQAVDARAVFVRGDAGDPEILAEIFAKREIDACLHFAASIEVGESVVNPAKYYANNVGQTLALLRALRAKPKVKLVFSSTAAVYGSPETEFISESSTRAPINPYGRTKMIAEMAIEDHAQAYGLGACILRYFNVAGASPSGAIGEAHDPESHLIPRLLKSAIAGQPKAEIYGADYPTPDGTCVRDYVHVTDLVSAHLLALEAAEAGAARVYNLGSEQGFSVRAVVSACERAVGKPFESFLRERRAGDPARLVASSEKIRRELGWRPERADLDAIVGDAWRWHRSHPTGYAAMPTIALENATARRP